MKRKEEGIYTFNEGARLAIAHYLKNINPNAMDWKASEISEIPGIKKALEHRVTLKKGRPERMINMVKRIIKECDSDHLFVGPMKEPWREWSKRQGSQPVKYMDLTDKQVEIFVTYWLIKNKNN